MAKKSKKARPRANGPKCSMAQQSASDGGIPLEMPGGSVLDAADASAGLARQGIEQQAGELRSYAGLLVLEVYEHVAARRSAGADGLRPARQILRGVTLIAQAEIGVVRGELDGGGEFLAVGDAQGEIPGREPGEHFRVHPRGVAELERGAGAGGEQLQKLIEHREVLAKVGRQLEEDRAELRP